MYAITSIFTGCMIAPISSSETKIGAKIKCIMQSMFIIMNNNNIIHKFTLIFHETKKSVQTTDVLCNHKRHYTIHTATPILLVKQISQCIQHKLQSQEMLYNTYSYIDFTLDTNKLVHTTDMH